MRRVRDIIIDGSGTQYDPELVKTFLLLADEFEKYGQEMGYE